jgi:hypothetical protein
LLVAQAVHIDIERGLQFIEHREASIIGRLRRRLCRGLCLFRPCLERLEIGLGRRRDVADGRRPDAIDLRHGLLKTLRDIRADRLDTGDRLIRFFLQTFEIENQPNAGARDAAGDGPEPREFVRELRE